MFELLPPAVLPPRHQWQLFPLLLEVAFPSLLLLFAADLCPLVFTSAGTEGQEGSAIVLCSFSYAATATLVLEKQLHWGGGGGGQRRREEDRRTHPIHPSHLLFLGVRV